MLAGVLRAALIGYDGYEFCFSSREIETRQYLYGICHLRYDLRRDETAKVQCIIAHAEQLIDILYLALRRDEILQALHGISGALCQLDHSVRSF